MGLFLLTYYRKAHQGRSGSQVFGGGVCSMLSGLDISAKFWALGMRKNQDPENMSSEQTAIKSVLNLNVFSLPNSNQSQAHHVGWMVCQEETRFIVFFIVCYQIGRLASNFETDDKVSHINILHTNHNTKYEIGITHLEHKTPSHKNAKLKSRSY